MEMDSNFMIKQFVAIDELKPSYISSAMNGFCEVYARAVLKLLFLLTEEEKFLWCSSEGIFFQSKEQGSFWEFRAFKHCWHLCYQTLWR